MDEQKIIEMPTENEKEDVSGTIRVKLDETFEYEDVTLDEITIDMNALTGKDAMEVLDELSMNGHVVENELTDTEFIPMLAARAMGIGFDVFENLPIRPYNRVKELVRMWLIPYDETSGVELNLQNLTGKESREIEAEAKKKGRMVLFSEYDEVYRNLLILRGSKLKMKDLEEMPVRKYLMLQKEVRSFLIS